MCRELARIANVTVNCREEKRKRKKLTARNFVPPRASIPSLPKIPIASPQPPQTHPSLPPLYHTHLHLPSPPPSSSRCAKQEDLSSSPSSAQPSLSSTDTLPQSPRPAPQLPPQSLPQLSIQHHRCHSRVPDRPRPHLLQPLPSETQTGSPLHLRSYHYPHGPERPLRLRRLPRTLEGLRRLPHPLPPLRLLFQKQRSLSTSSGEYKWKQMMKLKGLLVLKPQCLLNYFKHTSS